MKHFARVELTTKIYKNFYLESKSYRKYVCKKEGYYEK